jgi:hypothetical protein
MFPLQTGPVSIQHIPKIWGNQNSCVREFFESDERRFFDLRMYCGDAPVEFTFSNSLTHTPLYLSLSLVNENMCTTVIDLNYTKDGLFLHAKAPKQSISSNRIS